MGGEERTLTGRTVGSRPSTPTHHKTNHQPGPILGTAIRSGVRYESCLLHHPAAFSADHAALVPQARGAFDCLAPAALASASPRPGQVLLGVEAVGLNFRDVLNVLGLYPGDPGPPGGDVAGIVLAAGEGCGFRRGRDRDGWAGLAQRLTQDAVHTVPPTRTFPLPAWATASG